MPIRKSIALLLILALLLPAVSAVHAEDALSVLRSWNKEEGWQYVQVGQYMYEKDGTMAPVTWRVLYVEDGRMLMITEEVIDLCQPYHMDTKKDYDHFKEYKNKRGLPKLETYEETEIPEWCETVMFPVLIGEDPIAAAFIDEGVGRLFCMSSEEWCNTSYGFIKRNTAKPNPSRIAQVTPYVKDKKMYDWSAKMVIYEDGYVGSSYWTSTMRPGERRMQIVGINGHLSWGGWIRVNVGIRPAARLDLSRVLVVSGSGTVKDPYVLAANEAAIPADQNAGEATVADILPPEAENAEEASAENTAEPAETDEENAESDQEPQEDTKETDKTIEAPEEEEEEEIEGVVILHLD